MTIGFPHEFAWVGVLIGMEWPEGDEDSLRRIASAWNDAASDIDGLASDLDAAAQAVRQNMAGATSDALEKVFHELLNGDLSPENMAKAARAAADMSEASATNIEYTKISFYATLAITAAQILLALAMAAESFGLSLTSIPPIEAIAQAAVRIGLRELIDKINEAVARRILLRMAQAAATNAALSGLQDAGIQGYQIAMGGRKGFDAGQFGKTVATGAIGGAVGGAAGGLADRGLGKLAGSALDDIPGLGKRWGGKSLSGAIEGTANATGASAAGTGLFHDKFDPMSIVGGGLSGGLTAKPGKAPDTDTSVAGASHSDAPPPHSDGAGDSTTGRSDGTDPDGTRSQASDSAAAANGDGARADQGTSAHDQAGPLTGQRESSAPPDSSDSSHPMDGQETQPSDHVGQTDSNADSSTPESSSHEAASSEPSSEHSSGVPADEPTDHRSPVSGDEHGVTVDRPDSAAEASTTDPVPAVSHTPTADSTPMAPSAMHDGASSPTATHATGGTGLPRSTDAATPRSHETSGNATAGDTRPTDRLAGATENRPTPHADGGARPSDVRLDGQHRSGGASAGRVESAAKPSVAKASGNVSGHEQSRVDPAHVTDRGPTQDLPGGRPETPSHPRTDHSEGAAFLMSDGPRTSTPSAAHDRPIAARRGAGADRFGRGRVDDPSRERPADHNHDPADPGPPPRNPGVRGDSGDSGRPDMPAMIERVAAHDGFQPLEIRDLLHRIAEPHAGREHLERLSDNELKVLKHIDDALEEHRPDIAHDVMRKVVSGGQLDSILKQAREGGDPFPARFTPDRVTGCMSVRADVAGVMRTPHEIVEGLRLDYPIAGEQRNPFLHLGDNDHLFVVEGHLEQKDGLIDSPNKHLYEEYLRRFPDSGTEPPETSMAMPEGEPPHTGVGLPGSSRALTPEYYAADKTTFADGAELKRINPDGTSDVMARLVNGRWEGVAPADELTPGPMGAKSADHAASSMPGDDHAGATPSDEAHSHDAQPHDHADSATTDHDGTDGAIDHADDAPLNEPPADDPGNNCGPDSLATLGDHFGRQVDALHGEPTGAEGMSGHELEARGGGELRSTDPGALRERLEELGDGSAAAVVVEHSHYAVTHGEEPHPVGAHAYTAINRDGDIVLMDGPPNAQVEMPLPEDFGHRAWAMSFDPDGNPVHPVSHDLDTAGRDRLPGERGPDERIGGHPGDDQSVEDKHSIPLNLDGGHGARDGPPGHDVDDSDGGHHHDHGHDGDDATWDADSTNESLEPMHTDPTQPVDAGDYPFVSPPTDVTEHEAVPGELPRFERPYVRAGDPAPPPGMLETFAGEVRYEPVMPGETIYRDIGEGQRAAGGFWTSTPTPSDSYLRSDLAVLNKWNGGGGRIEYTPSEPVPAWRGTTAPQDATGSELDPCYLPGGGEQIGIVTYPNSALPTEDMAPDEHGEYPHWKIGPNGWKK